MAAVANIGASRVSAILFLSVLLFCGSLAQNSPSSIASGSVDSLCPPPNWPIADSCSGHEENCAAGRCVCADGFSGVTDAIDYSLMGVDCCGNIVARRVLHIIALTAGIFHQIAVCVGFAFSIKWVDFNIKHLSLVHTDLGGNLFFLLPIIALYGLALVDIFPSQSIAAGVILGLVPTLTFLGGTIHNLFIVQYITDGMEFPRKHFARIKNIVWTYYGCCAVGNVAFATLLSATPRFASAENVAPMQRIFMSLLVVVMIISLSLFGITNFWFSRTLIRMVEKASPSARVSPAKKKRFLVTLDSTFKSAFGILPIVFLFLVPILFLPMLFDYLFSLVVVAATLSSSVRPIVFMYLRRDSEMEQLEGASLATTGTVETDRHSDDDDFRESTRTGEDGAPANDAGSAGDSRSSVSESDKSSTELSQSDKAES